MAEAQAFEVRGADDFLRLSKALKSAGLTELRKELNKQMRVAAKPLIAEARKGATRLPARGGLAAKVARAPMRVQTRTGTDPGVRIVVTQKAGYASRSANDGTIRHPVFGSGVWVSQQVPPGWFDEPLQASAPTIRGALEQALENVAEQIVREAK